MLISYGPDLDQAITDMASVLEGRAGALGGYAPRWLALKYLEGDAEVIDALRIRDAEGARILEEMTAKVADHCQKTLGTYPEALIADYRYGFIRNNFV